MCIRDRGGTVRDVMVGRIPTVLRSGLYAVPALIGAALTVLTAALGLDGLATTLGAAAVCFLVRMLGLRYGLNAPSARR